MLNRVFALSLFKIDRPLEKHQPYINTESDTETIKNGIKSQDIVWPFWRYPSCSVIWAQRTFCPVRSTRQNALFPVDLDNPEEGGG